MSRMCSATFYKVAIFGGGQIRSVLEKIRSARLPYPRRCADAMSGGT